MTGAPKTRDRLRAAVLTIPLVLATGCTLSLVELDVPANENSVAWVRYRGEAWGCHERPSAYFSAYLVCPERDTVLGVVNRNGKLAFACPEDKPSTCARLAEELLSIGGVPGTGRP